MTCPPPATIVVGLADFEMLKSAEGASAVVALPVSAPMSVVVADVGTSVTLFSEPVALASTVPWIVTTTRVPAGMTPNVQATDVSHVPLGDVAVVAVYPAGTGSPSTTSRASDGPRLSMVIV